MYMVETNPNKGNGEPRCVRIVKKSGGAVAGRTFIFAARYFRVHQNEAIHLIKEFPRWREKGDGSYDDTMVEHVKRLRKHGFPLRSWIDKLDTKARSRDEVLLFASNGIQSNYISPYGFCVVDGTEIRQAYALESCPMKESWALVHDPSDLRGTRMLSFEGHSPTRVIDKVTGRRVNLAVGGVPLIRRGEDVSKMVASSHGKRASADSVLWLPEKTRAAFSALGFRANGEMISIAIFENVTIFEITEILRLDFACVEAVLCGGSADVQQFVASAPTPTLMVAPSRPGSTNPGKSRRLNFVFSVSKRRSSDDSDTKTTEEIDALSGL